MFSVQCEDRRAHSPGWKARRSHLSYSAAHHCGCERGLSIGAMSRNRPRQLTYDGRQVSITRALFQNLQAFRSYQNRNLE